MIGIEDERREAPRIPVTRTCKVYEPRSRRYIPGSTCNVAPGGMLLRLNRAMELESGDRLFIAVSGKRRTGLVRTDDMIEATVTRAMPVTSGETAVAVRFSHPEHSQVLPLAA